MSSPSLFLFIPLLGFCFLEGGSEPGSTSATGFGTKKSGWIGAWPAEECDQVLPSEDADCATTMTYQVTHISENGFGSNGEGIPPFRLKSIRDFGTSQRAMASSIRRFFASSFSCSEVSDHRCLNKINRTFLRKRCVTTFRHGDKFGEQKFLSALTELIYVSIKKKLVCPLTTREKKLAMCKSNEFEDLFKLGC